MNTPHTALHLGPGALAAARSSAAQHLIVLGDPPPDALPGFHRSHAPAPNFGTLTLAVGEPCAMLRELTANVDEFHLHGPLADQEHAALYRQFARLAKPDARLILHAGLSLSPHMQPAGFMPCSALGARYCGGPHRDALRPHTALQHAIIIGAGLAGSAVAYALARRGWQVTLLEQHPQPAEGASGNLAGVMSPMMSKDQNLASRLSRASFLYLLDELRAFDHTPRPARWSSCGVLQLAKDARDVELIEAVLRMGWPQGFCHGLDTNAIARRFGLTPPGPALFFPEGGWLNPPSLCKARLAHPNITAHYASPVSQLTETEDGWQVTSGERTFHAPVLILANSFAARDFVQAARLHFKTVRGQVTHLPDRDLPQVDGVWQREGYLTPAVDGVRCLAATYDFDNFNPELEIASHQQNLAKLPQLFPGFDTQMSPHTLGGRVGFRALTIDRLPLVGLLPDFSGAPPASPRLRTLPRHRGLYGLLGLGSRGITWSALAGEILASQINAEPLPIEQAQADAIDPARFWLRSLRNP